MLAATFSADTPLAKRYVRYIETANTLLAQYDGKQPFAAYLKKYFAAHKKHGGTDRKSIALLCYGYFRLGKMISALTPALQWQAVILLYPPAAPIASVLLPEKIVQHLTDSVEQKILYLQERGTLGLYSIFSFSPPLSEGIDNHAFQISHLQQPKLFLRIRKGKDALVEEKLNRANIAFEKVGAHALALTNATSVDTILELDKEAVVQDISSQQIASYFELIPVKSFHSFSVWDCCAASGGKSILAWDVLPHFSLTVSDVRESILNNLVNRFAKADIQPYKKQVIDLTQHQSTDKQYQLIIADVPCSGSGTWGRTPEYLLHFQEQALELYTSRQEKILAQVLPALAPGGYLLYITCSVFRCENEDRVNWLLSKYPLRLIKAGLITGYTKGADTLFAALLQLQ